MTYVPATLNVATGETFEESENVTVPGPDTLDHEYDMVSPSGSVDPDADMVAVPGKVTV